MNYDYLIGQEVVVDNPSYSLSGYFGHDLARKAKIVGVEQHTLSPYAYTFSLDGVEQPVVSAKRKTKAANIIVNLVLKKIGKEGYNVTSYRCRLSQLSGLGKGTYKELLKEYA